MIKNVYKSLFRFSYGTWIQALISILSLPIFARFLNPSEYAVISLFILIYTILISIIFLGIDQSFVRFYYDYSDKIKYINSYLIISLTSYTIFSFLVFYYKNIISIYIIDSDSYFLIGLLLLHLFSGIILRYLTLVLRCEDLSILYSNSQIFLSISYVILGVICILFFKNVYSLIIGAVISQCLVAIYLYTKLNKIIVFNFSNNLIDRSFTKEITKYSLPFIPIIFLDWLFLNFDKTILREYTDLNSLGIYFTAYKIVFVLNIIQIGFKSFWFPYALNKYKEDPDALIEFKKLSKNLIFFFTIIILGLICIRDILKLLFPEEYHGVSEIFPLLLIIPFISTLYDIATFGINYFKKTYYHIFTYLIALSIGIPLIYYLIPDYSLFGASIAVVISSLIYFVIGAYFNSFFIQSYIDWINLSINILLIIISAVSIYFGFFNTPIYILILFIIINVKTITGLYKLIINLKIKKI